MAEGREDNARKLYSFNMFFGIYVEGQDMIANLADAMVVIREDEQKIAKLIAKEESDRLELDEKDGATDDLHERITRLEAVVDAVNLHICGVNCEKGEGRANCKGCEVWQAICALNEAPTSISGLEPQKGRRGMDRHEIALNDGQFARKVAVSGHQHESDTYCSMCAFRADAIHAYRYSLLPKYVDKSENGIRWYDDYCEGKEIPYAKQFSPTKKKNGEGLHELRIRTRNTTNLDGRYGPDSLWGIIYNA